MSTVHPFEWFLINAAREFRDGEVTFVGFHWPMVAARIARHLHAPDLVVVYECGIVEDRLTPQLSTSPSDLRAAVGAPMCGGSMDALYSWLGRGRVARTFLEAPIVDRRGNVNTTVVGDYDRPTVRLPGSGGGTELGSLGRGLVLLSTGDRARAYPERVDYVTSPGHLSGPGERERLGYPAGRGPEVLLTPLGRLTFDSREGFVPAALRPGVSWQEARACFRWLREEPGELSELPEPTAEEVAATRHVLREAREMRYRLPADLPA
ncbi:CoA-transferase [Polymorphospora sp. NPDC051019]|uniref:CoA-transferase n=1 Tax=Polymorphospora sp. NPDC051019 TaxID=3155725 RepID=UPI00343019C3